MVWQNRIIPILSTSQLWKIAPQRSRGTNYFRTPRCQPVHSPRDWIQTMHTWEEH